MSSRVVRTATFDTLLPAYADALLTYDEVGATRDRQLPAGYGHLRRLTYLGSGQPAFDRAVAALFGWEMHRRSGLRVVAASTPAAVGTTVVMGLGVVPGAAYLVIPCRIVYVLDEPARKGFGYGTLPEHPEIGEEAFVVSLDERGDVWLETSAFSRPGNRLVRAAGPLARVAQAVATRRYERALAALATGSST